MEDEKVIVTVRTNTLNALLAMTQATCANPTEAIATLLYLARDLHNQYRKDDEPFLIRVGETLRRIDEGVKSNGPSLSDVPAGTA